MYSNIRNFNMSKNRYFSNRVSVFFTLNKLISLTKEEDEIKISKPENIFEVFPPPSQSLL